MSDIDYMIEVLEAYKEGKEIEYSRKDEKNGNRWIQCSSPIWDFGHYNYRIKPNEKNIYQISIEEAFKKGEVIQVKFKNEPDTWRDINLKDNYPNYFSGPIVFDWEKFDYRIKPEEKANDTKTFNQIVVENVYRREKAVQVKLKESNIWYEKEGNDFLWDICDYRIKPEEKTEYQKSVEQAYKDGKKIQIAIDGTWRDMSFPSFQWDTCNYRIKPAKKKLYLWAFKNNKGWSITESYYESQGNFNKDYKEHQISDSMCLLDTMIEVDE